MNHGYRLHQMQGNQIYGFHKAGYLLKKSEGKMRVKAWRKRRCEIIDGFLFIYRSDETKPPTKLNLLTCQVKLVPGKEKKCFDLISFNRTYHFQVEDEHDITAWVYVLINCKEGALKKQFDDPNNTDIVDFASSSFQNNKQTDEQQTFHRLGAEQHVQQQLIRQVQALTGNNRCVDCYTTKDRPTWLSTNLGILVCIECSGIHRDLGVHISRIQSLTLDNINTSQLSIAHNMGNDFFNDIFESKLRQLEMLAADVAWPNFETPKLKPDSSMERRCEFIKAKYIQKRFCHNIHRDDQERAKCLKEAVISKDLRKLLQLFGEGFDIASCISNQDDGDDDGDNYCEPTSKPQLSSAHDCRDIDRLYNNRYHHNHNHSHHHDHHYKQNNNNIINNNNNNNNNSINQHQKNSYNQRNLMSQNDSMACSRAGGGQNSSSIDDSIDSTLYQSSKPIIVDQDTSIHLALSCQASREVASVQFECDLFILDFIIQNSRAINKQNALGETPLHYCAKFNLPECMKLLLRSGADVNIRNANGETALDIIQTVRPIGYKHLIEILGGTSGHCGGGSGDTSTSSIGGAGCLSGEDGSDLNASTITHFNRSATNSSGVEPMLTSSAMKKIADEVIAYHTQSAEKKRHSIASIKQQFKYSTESNSIL